MVFHSGAQNNAWKCRLVWTVGIMLGLETEAGTEAIDDAIFAMQVIRQMVSGIELHSWLSCVDLHNAA